MLPVDPSSAATQVLAAAAGGVKPGFQATLADIWGGLIGDRIHQWRQRNLISVLEKTADFIKQKGISLEATRPLPDGELYLIFDGASKSDTPQLQELWSALLARRLERRDQTGFMRTIASTLELMSEIDAAVLRFLSIETPILWAENRRVHALTEEAWKRKEFKLSNFEESWNARLAYEAELIEPYLTGVMERLHEWGLNVPEEVDIAKHNLIKLGLIRREDIGPPSVSSITRREYSFEEDDGSEALNRIVEHFNEQVGNIENWANESSSGDRVPLWRFRFPRTAEVNFELTPLGEHLLGKVGRSEA